MYDLCDGRLQRYWFVVLAQRGGMPKTSVRYLNLCRAAKTTAEKMEALVELAVNHLVWTIHRL